MGGPESRFGRGGEEKHFQLLPEFETPLIQSVDTIELSRLSSCIRGYTKVLTEWAYGTLQRSYKSASILQKHLRFTITISVMSSFEVPVCK
jgi:hypothetical protein